MRIKRGDLEKLIKDITIVSLEEKLHMYSRGYEEVISKYSKNVEEEEVLVNLIDLVSNIVKKEVRELKKLKVSKVKYLIHNICSKLIDNRLGSIVKGLEVV